MGELWFFVRSKDKIINIFLENLLARKITDNFYNDNSLKISQSKKSEKEFRNPKRPLKINNVRNNQNRQPMKTFNRFDWLSEDESLNEIPEGNEWNEKLVSYNKSRKTDAKDKKKYISRFHRRIGNQRIDNKKSNCSCWRVYY